MTTFAHNNPLHDSRPPVIILGAARSGTKLLRGLIAATGCYAEVPFDVNYIWRYGNESCPHDALAADQLTERTRRFVRTYLPRCARLRPGNAAFIEKTVSNILRVPFVRKVYPEAKYVAIVRDGRDVVESAERCWRESPPAGYVLAKLRTFPWRRCAPYGWKYAVGLVRRRLRLDRHWRSWGPRYPGINNDLRCSSLLEVCAHQWLACIEHYEQSRRLLARSQLHELRYEDLVNSPQDQIHRLCDFLAVDDRRSVLQFGRQTISADRLGSSRRLPQSESQKVLEIIGPALDRWGYSKKPTARVA